MELTELIQNNEVWTLKPIGEIHAKTAPEMWHFDSVETLAGELAKANVESLIIDLSETTFMDSHGLRLLINARKTFNEHNLQVTLRNPNPHISRLFKLMRLEGIYTIEP